MGKFGVVQIENQPTNQLLGILQTRRPPLEHRGGVGLPVVFVLRQLLALSLWASMWMLKWTLFRTRANYPTIMTRLVLVGT